jgi:hypothetical protein
MPATPRATTRSVRKGHGTPLEDPGNQLSPRPVGRKSKAQKLDEKKTEKEQKSNQGARVPRRVSFDDEEGDLLDIGDDEEGADFDVAMSSFECSHKCRNKRTCSHGCCKRHMLSPLNEDKADGEASLGPSPSNASLLPEPFTPNKEDHGSLAVHYHAMLTPAQKRNAKAPIMEEAPSPKKDRVEVQSDQMPPERYTTEIIKAMAGSRKAKVTYKMIATLEDGSPLKSAFIFFNKCGNKREYKGNKNDYEGAFLAFEEKNAESGMIDMFNQLASKRTYDDWCKFVKAAMAGSYNRRFMQLMFKEWATMKMGTLTVEEYATEHSKYLYAVKNVGVWVDHEAGDVEYNFVKCWVKGLHESIRVGLASTNTDDSTFKDVLLRAKDIINAYARPQDIDGPSSRANNEQFVSMKRKISQLEESAKSKNKKSDQTEMVNLIVNGINKHIGKDSNMDCFDFKKGKCTRKDDCKFAHNIGTDMVVVPPGLPPGLPPGPPGGNPYVTHQMNQAAGGQNLGMPPPPPPMPGQGKGQDDRSQKPCRQLAAGKCTWGAKCRFSHAGN